MADVASSLEFFGDLAVVRSAPVTMSFDATARSVEFATGITVDVPTGAFAAPTEVTAVIVDLEFDQYADNAPEGSAYVLSTKADVDLGVPLVLEVAEAPDTVTVMQPVDDQWQVVEVSAGSTTRIPITHFSEVPTLVVVPSEGIPVMTSPEPFGDSPASFLAACIPTVSNILRSTDHYGDDDYSLSDQLAYSFCARALVTKYSPSGVRVEVGCVGAKMDGDDGVGLFAAIDSCAKGQDAETEQLDSTTPPDSEDDEDLSQEEAPSVVDSGQPFLRVIDADVEFAGCPDPNFPDVCQYSFAVTLDYVTPIVPPTLIANALVGTTHHRTACLGVRACSPCWARPRAISPSRTQTR